MNSILLKQLLPHHKKNKEILSTKRPEGSQSLEENGNYMIITFFYGKARQQKEEEEEGRRMDFSACSARIIFHVKKKKPWDGWKVVGG